MTKKKKKKQTAPTKSTKPTKLVEAEQLSSDQQKEATERMAELFKEIAKPPEGFLPLLDRLNVPYQMMCGKFFGGGDSFGTEQFSTDLVEEELVDGEQVVIIRMNDLIAGEERNQAQGSVLNRLTRKRIDDVLEGKIGE